MSHINVERIAAVGRITIERPERFNALDVETARDFRRAGLQLARDASIAAVILRGQPGVFCCGADLKEIRARGASHYGDGFKDILEYIHSTISEIRRAPKPFIAAVDGVAAAGGLGLALCCDLVIATPRASFEWAYSKTGLTGAESMTFFLPRLVGLRKAMELVLLNPRLTAAEALGAGLITSVYDGSDFDGHVIEAAERIASGSWPAFATAKELLNQAAGMDRLDAHLDRELGELVRIANGREFAERLSAFFDKRRQPAHA